MTISSISITAQRLRDLREYMGLTRPAFAELVNVPAGTLKNYELGYRDPNFATMATVVEQIGLTYGKTEETAVGLAFKAGLLGWLAGYGGQQLWPGITPLQKTGTSTARPHKE